MRAVRLIGFYPCLGYRDALIEAVIAVFNLVGRVGAVHTTQVGDAVIGIGIP